MRVNILSLVREVTLDSEVPDSDARGERSYTLSGAWGSLIKVNVGHDPASPLGRRNIKQTARLLIEQGFTLQPLDWLALYMSGHGDWSRLWVLQDIYLTTDGAPNAPDCFGWTPLYSTLMHLRCRPKNSINEEHWKGLLVPLIKAGADIYQIVQSQTDQSEGYAQTLTDMFFRLGFGHIWEQTLTRSGLCPRDVYEESDRRLAEHRKLHGACRTGVDIEPVVSQPDTSGLRQRSSKGVEDVLDA